MTAIMLNFDLIGSLVLIVLGGMILIAGGESLVRGASRIAVAMKIPPLIVGLTIVAFCTSAPELAVSLLATLKGNADIAIGNVVGSNICNICLILGLSALIKPILVSSTLIRREIPLMVAVAVLMYLFALLGASGSFADLLAGRMEGHIAVWQGTVFLGLLACYIVWTILEVRRNKGQNEEYVKDVEEGTAPSPNESGTQTGETARGMLVNFVLLLLGIAMLVLGSEMMVQGAVKIAKSLGVSELIIGLTILAVGTSLPELVVSIVSVLKGKTDIAVGNAVGSNIFNVLGVLGPSALFSGSGITVTAQAMRLDIPVMLFLSLSCIVICVTGYRISRGEGVFLLLCYGAYLGFLCISGAVGG